MDRKDAAQLVQRIDFFFSSGTPAQQRNKVDQGVLKIAHIDKIFIRGVAVAFGIFDAALLDDLAHMHVNRLFPAEGIVQQIVFGRGGQIL